MRLSPGAEANLSLARAGTSASSLSQAEGQVNSAEVSYQSAITNLSDTKAVNAQQTAQAYSAYTAAQAQATTDGCTPGDTTPPCPQDEAAVTQDYQQWQASEVKGTQGDDQAQDQVNADKVQWENAKSSLAALEDGSSSTSAQIAMDESQVEDRPGQRHQCAGRRQRRDAQGAVRRHRRRGERHRR